jgi:hypothetical protein
MIKVTMNPESQEIKYPCLMIDHGKSHILIVEKKYKNTYSGSRIDIATGEIDSNHDGWIQDNYEPFNGSITISNHIENAIKKDEGWEEELKHRIKRLEELYCKNNE